MKTFSIIAAWGLVLCLLLPGCKVGDKQTAEDMTAQGYIAASVQDARGLDGCTFLLLLPDGEKFEPVSLPDDFKTDGLPVWVKYKLPGTPMGSICMVGDIVEIIDIKKR